MHTGRGTTRLISNVGPTSGSPAAVYSGWSASFCAGGAGELTWPSVRRKPLRSHAVRVQRDLVIPAGDGVLHATVRRLEDKIDRLAAEENPDPSPRRRRDG
jgi:hypothetical protein